jgi:hypothetical protein
MPNAQCPGRANAQCPMPNALGGPMPNAQNDLISRSVPQPEVGACCPNLSKIEATATKLIPNSADV